MQTEARERSERATGRREATDGKTNDSCQRPSAAGCALADARALNSNDSVIIRR